VVDRNDDATRGGYARLAGLIAMRKEARKDQGPVLVLDAGDYSMGTPFGAATREIGGELRLMSRMGYDATTFGNHETGKTAGREIKEWQAIMDHLRSLPVKAKDELPVIPVDERAAEVRAIKIS
jgi:hypothetical protein